MSGEQSEVQGQAPLGRGVWKRTRSPLEAEALSWAHAYCNANVSCAYTPLTHFQYIEYTLYIDFPWLPLHPLIKLSGFARMPLVPCHGGIRTPRISRPAALPISQSDCNEKPWKSASWHTGPWWTVVTFGTATNIGMCSHPPSFVSLRSIERNSSPVKGQCTNRHIIESSSRHYVPTKSWKVELKLL